MLFFLKKKKASAPVSDQSLDALLLIIFGGIPALAVSAAPNCVPVTRVCSETNVETGECLRFTNTFRCITDAPEKHRCEAPVSEPPEVSAMRTAAAGNPALEACKTGETRCVKKDDTGLCLLTETKLLCEKKPTGAGITVGEPRVTVSWRTIRTPDIDPNALGEGCRITAETCRAEGARDIPIENAPGETVSVTADCWDKVLTVSCPSSEAASSCQKLEAAGCEKVVDLRCEKTLNGHCVRWSATYRCKGREVTGDDIVTDNEIRIPGDVTEDTADCDRKTAEAAKAGLSCRALKRECVKAGTAPGLPCEEYLVTMQCTGTGGNGCAALNALERDGHCLRQGESTCEEKDADGRCVRESALFLCGESVSAEAVKPSTLLEEKPVPDYRETTDCVPLTAKPLRSGADPGQPRELRNTDCVKTAVTCSEGAGIRFVDGRPQYRDCWATTETWTCASGKGDECAALAAKPECRLVSETCTDPDDRTETGGCRRPTRVYRCKRPGTSGVIGEVCDGQTCIAGVCRPTDGKENDDFVNGLVQLEIGRQAAAYGSPTANRFFRGTVNTCKDRKGASSCCKSEYASDTSNAAFSVLLGFGVSLGLDYIRYLGSPYVYDLLSWSESTEPLLTALYGNAGPAGFNPSFSYWGASLSWSGSGGWNVSFSPGIFMATAAAHFVGRYTACNAEDVKTSMAKGQRLCHYVGTVCEKRVSGLGCVETAEKYVCFNSRLARIIQEEGRRQLNRGWGSADNPDARGFSVEELEKLDFSAMDLSEFTADVIRELRKNGGISEAEAAARAAERVAAMIKKEISPTAPVKGSVGTRAGLQPTTGSGQQP